MKHIATIPITQNGVRDIQQVKEMMAFVKDGGIFDDERLARHHSGSWAKNRISIARLEDGKEYFHDGHHRLLGIWLGGRKTLHDEEVEYFDITYAAYQEVNFETGWLTPFDLKTEIRVPNVHEFKQAAKALPRHSAESWVRSNRHLFCELRNGIHYTGDLARQLLGLGLV